MSNQDFLRRLPTTGQDLRRRARIQQRLHLDFALIFLLLLVTVYGLIVLYSASGQSASSVQRQGIYFLVGYIAMFTAAQVPVHVLRRMAPWAYAVGAVLVLLVLRSEGHTSELQSRGHLVCRILLQNKK